MRWEFVKTKTNRIFNLQKNNEFLKIAENKFLRFWKTVELFSNPKNSRILKFGTLTKKEMDKKYVINDILTKWLFSYLKHL